MTLSPARLKRLRTLASVRGRRTQGAFLIEGEKLVREAVTAAAPLRELLGTTAWLPALESLGSAAPVTPLSRADAERLSDTRTPQGCFAVVADTLPTAEVAIAALPVFGPLTVLALDRVQDAGNAGALIRVAAAFEVDLVLVGKGGADPAQPKVVRAATGAWFRQAIARSTDLPETLAALATLDCAIVGASPHGTPVHAAWVPERRVLVVGSEGSGFSAAVRPALSSLVTAPIAPAVESLNVAVAAGIILSSWRQAEGDDRCAS